jgi:hypothetical protein
VRFRLPVASVLHAGLPLTARTTSAGGGASGERDINELERVGPCGRPSPYPWRGRRLQGDVVDAIDGPVAMARYPGCLA